MEWSKKNWIPPFADTSEDLSTGRQMLREKAENSSGTTEIEERRMSCYDDVRIRLGKQN